MVRSSDVVWRVTDRCVIVRRVDESDGPQGARLVGGAALVWIAAEAATTLSELGAETGLDGPAVESAVAELCAGDWLRGSP